MGEVPGGQVVAVKRNIAARLLAEAKAKHSSLLRSSSAAQSSTVANEWTLYNLEVPRVECVIEDLEGIADSYRSASSCNFYDLMEEAHVMLRLSLTIQGERLGADRELLLRNMFAANCRKLADFSIRYGKNILFRQLIILIYSFLQVQQAGSLSSGHRILQNVPASFGRHF